MLWSNSSISLLPVLCLISGKKNDYRYPGPQLAEMKTASVLLHPVTARVWSEDRLSVPVNPLFGDLKSAHLHALDPGE